MDIERGRAQHQAKKLLALARQLNMIYARYETAGQQMLAGLTMAVGGILNDDALREAKQSVLHALRVLEQVAIVQRSASD